MNLRGLIAKHSHISYSCIATALLLGVGMTPANAQQSIVSDWSSHHVKFSSPGSEMDALMNGHRQEWQSYVNNPRYQWQQLKRSAARANRLSAPTSDFWNSQANRYPIDLSKNKKNSLQGLWTSNLAAAGSGTEQGAYPAVYDANFNTPSCTGDYAVFPVNATGGTSQPNIVVFNHLYVNSAKTGFCTGLTTPDVYAAYYVYPSQGSSSTVPYTAQGSPVSSETGTQIAFVVNDDKNDYVRLFVVTLGAGGTIAKPTELTDAGTYGGDAGATGGGTANGETYSVVLVAGNGSTDQSLTSPWVDYTNNVAYISSTGGKIYKVENVFKITTSTPAPSEVTTGGWPVTVASGSGALTSPVEDPATGNVIVGANNGELYCITSAGKSCGSFYVAASSGNAAGTTASTNGAVIDAPVVLDNGNTTGTTGWAFAEATYTATSNQAGSGTTKGTANTISYSVLAQAPLSSTGFGTVVGANMGKANITATYTSNGNHTPTITLDTPSLYGGDFDNEYYNSSGGSYTGNLYFCGVENATSSTSANSVTYNTIPELWRIGFTGAGTITGSPVALDTLASNSTATQASGCAPLTEFYNANANSGAGVDYLFLGVSGYGAPTGCETAGTHDGCIMSFELPASGPTTLAPTAEYSLTGNGDGSSGFVIDNQSTDAGASQIYFFNLQTGDATAVSQAALQ